METRNEVFQKLKPPCVSLSQAALGLNSSRGDVQSVSNRLQTLHRTLSAVVTIPNSLDPKLAEYVFFPISQVLKASQQISIRALELCLQCIAILVDQGWRQDIPPQLAAQIVILCSLLGEKKPKGLSFAVSTDELQASAFWCLFRLFSVAGESPDTKAVLTGEANFPQLGQTISTLLDGVHDGESTEVQIAAIDALYALLSDVADREIHAGFLPGIVSKLTRVLKPQTKMRRNYRVLLRCLDIIQTLLHSTMSVEKYLNGASGMPVTTYQNTSNARKTMIDARWQEVTAGQLKPALDNIFRLWSHSRDDVSEAIASLCIVLLRDCRIALANCSLMALQTLICIFAANTDNMVRADLEDLVNTQPSIATLLLDVLHDWLQSLSMVMHSSDEHNKASKVQQISMAYKLLIRSGADTSSIDRLLASALRDSIVVTISVPSKLQQPVPTPFPVASPELHIVNSDRNRTTFSQPLVGSKAVEESLGSIEKAVTLISSSPTSSTFASELAKSLRRSQGDAQIANFWLLLTATQTIFQRQSATDDFVVPEEGNARERLEYLEDLYSFSLSVLTNQAGEGPDSRLEALALRGIALQAKIAGREFRYELLDVLYPVLCTLTSHNEKLQQDSITTLNILTTTCGYNSVHELIVDNVDYLTNSVSLKLNAFDISPQAPQVLLMMVRLAGPSLLPYLEDTIESVFAALEDYHGYPLLVELLFKVLSVMAEEGAKAPQLMIKNSAEIEPQAAKVERWHPTSIVGLTNVLKERREDEAARQSTKVERLDPHPEQPWKGVETGNDDDGDSGADEPRDQAVDDTELLPPAPKTYNLLLKITELTQHFLPAASPSLRTSLLSLIRTTVPAIAKHENSFLPLINTLWPEVVSRLDDSEPHVIATALDVVRLLCEHACDFMRTRVVQLWPRLLDIYRFNTSEGTRTNSVFHENTKDLSQQNGNLTAPVYTKQAMSRTHSTSADYTDTTSSLILSALTSTLIGIVQYVQVSPELLDEALHMLEPYLDRPAVLSAFEHENADALWLTRITTGRIARPAKPVAPTSAEWRFVELPN